MPDEAPAPEPAAATPSGSGAATPPEDWESRFRYLLADFENFRRRSSKEKEAATRQARAALLRELLPLLEAFRAARDALGHLGANDPVRRGLELLDREWSTFLHHEGVEAVAEVGRPFQAEEAEAVGEVAASPAVPDGSVAEIVQQGYRFFGGLLRPAKVVVARTREAEPGHATGPSDADEPPEASS
ncbi:MAG TPA: nucleotide exchange factor GrpE [Thermoplasmata archaeon]|nr:nucleotide exchange factor GrpE [Thermoplasmata archaeon]